MPDPELESYLWSAGIALAVALHLAFHPQLPRMRTALRWVIRHPIPWLLLTLGLVVVHFLATPEPELPSDHTIAYDWAGLWLDSALFGLRQFALLFHEPVVLPALIGISWADAIWQALLCAFGQVWLGCYLLDTSGLFQEVGMSWRQTLDRWRSILVLALYYAPCRWLMDKTAATEWTWVNAWLPEALIFMAPLPLAIAATSGDWGPSGVFTLRSWMNAGLSFLFLAVTGIVMLTLLRLWFAVIWDVLPQVDTAIRILFQDLLLAGVRSWLFVSAALLLIKGGYDDMIPDGDLS